MAVRSSKWNAAYTRHPGLAAIPQFPLLRSVSIRSKTNTAGCAIDRVLTTNLGVCGNPWAESRGPEASAEAAFTRIARG